MFIHPNILTVLLIIMQLIIFSVACVWPNRGKAQYWNKSTPLKLFCKYEFSCHKRFLSGTNGKHEKLIFFLRHLAHKVLKYLMHKTLVTMVVSLKSCLFSTWGKQLFDQSMYLIVKVFLDDFFHSCIIHLFTYTFITL